MSEAALQAVLDEGEAWAVAVSGGVDSMTLAYLAHRTAPDTTTIYHARSAAVPAEATERVRRYASRHGWRLEVIDAGELADPRYLANPHDRCFWCKTNLYSAIVSLTGARVTGQVIASGANTDDLGDFRPGLGAAAEHGVRHPWIEAGIGKATIRRIAAAHGLHDLAELPASPCLSSRIETGMPVTVSDLAAIDVLERRLHATLEPETLRCRRRPFGIEIELDASSLAACDRRAIAAIAADVMRAHGLAGEVRFARYRRGSAFLVPRPG